MKLIFRNCPCCTADKSLPFRGERLPPGLIENSRNFTCTNSLHGFHFNLVRCQVCETSYANPCPSEADLRALYSGVVDPLYAEIEKAREKTFDRVLSRLGSPGTLLEIGAYTGKFLERASLRGFDCHGIEPSSSACVIARQRGFDVVCGAAPEISLGEVRFDRVVAWDVLEHLLDPYAFLRFASGYTKDHGQIHFSTINQDALVARLLGKRWPWLMPMHLTYFSLLGIQKLIGRAVPRTKSVEIFPYAHYTPLWYPAEKLLGSLGLGAKKLVAALGLSNCYVPVALGDVIHVKVTL